MGTYHTSITLRDDCYSFAAVSGITKCTIQNEPTTIPPNASLQESIVLGSCTLETRGDVNRVVNGLRHSFHGTSYHLANRNCNHFTETFATALTMGDRLIDERPKLVPKYPAWVNRLAKTGTSLGLNGGDVCNVWEEARRATGAELKVGHGFSSSEERTKRRVEKSKKKKKKELTERQKVALAKLKSKA